MVRVFWSLHSASPAKLKVPSLLQNKLQNFFVQNLVFFKSLLVQLYEFPIGLTYRYNHYSQKPRIQTFKPPPPLLTFTPPSPGWVFSILLRKKEVIPYQCTKNVGLDGLFPVNVYACLVDWTKRGIHLLVLSALSAPLCA